MVINGTFTSKLKMNAKKTQRKTQKKVTGHLHGRIKKLADAAIARGDIINCDRYPGDTYIITLNDDERIPITYTAVGAGTLLYLLNSLAEGTIKPEPIILTNLPISET